MKENFLTFTQGQMAYYVMNDEGLPIVFLHGWGRSFADFVEIASNLSGYQVIGVDFLGFGKSSIPLTPLTIEDYTNHLKTLLKELQIESPILVAHSFGGRVAIKYCAENPFTKLILVSSAGIKHNSIKRIYKIYRYKFLKKIYKVFAKQKYENLIKNSGSKDYQNAFGVMKKTLSNVVNYSSKKDLKKIKGRVYLLWGINDSETKYQDALIMKKILKDATLIPFYESGHFCFFDEQRKFINELNKLLKE